MAVPASNSVEEPEFAGLNRRAKRASFARSRLKAALDMVLGATDGGVTF